MTETSKNNLLSGLQTTLLSLCTTAALGCFVFLWNINAFVSRQAEINKVVDDKMTEHKNKMDYLDATMQNLNLRITILENKKTK